MTHRWISKENKDNKDQIPLVSSESNPNPNQDNGNIANQLSGSSDFMKWFAVITLNIN